MLLTNKIAREHKRLVHQAVYRLKNRYPWADEGDLRGEGFLIMVQSAQTYDENLGKFSTKLTNDLRALSRPFDPRSAKAQESKSLRSLSDHIGGDENLTLEDTIGALDSNFLDSVIWDFLEKCPNPLVRDYAFDYFAGLVGSLTEGSCKKWAMGKGLDRKGSIQLWNEFVTIVKNYARG